MAKTECWRKICEGGVVGDGEREGGGGGGKRYLGGNSRMGTSSTSSLQGGIIVSLQASVWGLEYYHPTMGMLWGHGGRPKRKRCFCRGWCNWGSGVHKTHSLVLLYVR